MMNGDEADWIDEHVRAAREIIDFFAGDGISLGGAKIADIGCGDGIIDLALVNEVDIKSLVGFDLVATDEVALLRTADEYGLASSLPGNLTFEKSFENQIPVSDGYFDFVISWSTFEHVFDLESMASEIRRILKPGGSLFVQLWPFYDSQWGSHLWDFCQPFHHLLNSLEESQAIAHQLHDHSNPRHTDVIKQSHHLNRIKLDDLQKHFQSVGLLPRKVFLYSETVHIPEALATRPISELLISGVKMILS